MSNAIEEDNSKVAPISPLFKVNSSPFLKTLVSLPSLATSWVITFDTNLGATEIISYDFCETSPEVKEINSSDVLRELVSNIDILSYRELIPRMNDIFIKLVS